MYKKLSSLFGIAAVIMLMGQGCINFGGGQAGYGPMGAFRTADKGETWQQINAYPTAQGIKNLAVAKVHRLFTDPGDPNALYMATRGQGLFYTYDKGDNWRQVEAPEIKGKYIYGVAVDPTNKCSILVTDGTHIYKTIDCSRTWTTVYNEVRPDQRFVAMAIDYGNPKIVYAALIGGEVIVSSDAGINWHVVKRFENAVLQELMTDPLTPGRVYVASAQNGFTRSDNNGQTWVSLTDGLKTFNDSLYFYRLVLHPTEKNTVFWISKYGILRSTDAGKTWTDMKLLPAPGSVNIYSFAVNPNNPKEMYYTGTVLGEKNTSRSVFYRSLDGGANWVTKKLPTNTVPVSIKIHPKDGTVFVGFTIPEEQ